MRTENDLESSSTHAKTSHPAVSRAVAFIKTVFLRTKSPSFSASVSKAVHYQRCTISAPEAKTLKTQAQKHQRAHWSSEAQGGSRECRTGATCSAGAIPSSPLPFVTYPHSWEASDVEVSADIIIGLISTVQDSKIQCWPPV